MVKEQFKLRDGHIVTIKKISEQNIHELIPVYNTILAEGIFFHNYLICV